jgi:hypothetical protein
MKYHTVADYYQAHRHQVELVDLTQTMPSVFDSLLKASAPEVD